MSFAVGDFNGDGRPDVAILYFIGVAIQLGNGDGTLQASIHSTLSFLPGTSPLPGTLTAMANWILRTPGTLRTSSILHSVKVTGLFRPGPSGSGVSLLTDASSNTVAQGDFNGDGKPDLAVSNSGATTVNVFLGGQFSGLSIAATHAGNFRRGQAGVYQITIQNPAFAGTGTVTVTDTLPAGLSATAISGTGWACTLSTLICTRSDGLNWRELSGHCDFGKRGGQPFPFRGYQPGIRFQRRDN